MLEIRFRESELSTINIYSIYYTMKTKLLFFIVFAATTMFTTAEIPVDTTRVTPAKPFVIVLDAGHGGHDPGKVVGSVREKDIALNIVKLIGAKLEKNPAFKVIYTRKTDVFIPLDERGAIANRAKADFFVSVHCNAADATSAAGNETWILGTSKGSKANLEVVRAENSVILLEDNYKERYVGFDPNDPSSFAGALIDAEQYLENSIDLAARVQNNFLRDLARKNRGVKQANFAVLRMSYMPSVLIETGFITNTEEKNFLSSDEGQQKVANAIFNSIIQYHADRDINEFVIEDIDVEKVIPEIVLPENRVDKPTTSSSSTSGPVKNGTVYKVQLAASSKKIAESPSNFNNLPKISRARVGSLYKYFTGAEATESAARELLAIAKSKGYAEAFIVTEKNGVISKL